MNSNLKYGIRDCPKKWYEWIVFTLQQVLSVFVATVLIAQICSTPISACLFGACIGTLIYQIITGFKSPIFISSCGATVSAVLGALSVNGTKGNYLMVFCGGLIILLIYGIFAAIVKFTGVKTINKIFPPTIVSAVTMVIGLNLATFLVSYLGQSGESAMHQYLNTTAALSNTQLICFALIAVVTMLITALVSQYGKGFMRNIPFLFGICGGYLLAIIINYVFKVNIISFEAFKNISWYPDLTCFKWSTDQWSWANLGATALYFVPVAICALLEHYSDHKTLSNIIGTDLTEEPGLHRTLLGDGVASAVGTAVCGLPNTSYGESIATIGFSKVASIWVITAAAACLGVLSFIGPIQALVQSIPPYVFGGCAMILYGFIAASGLKTLINNKVNLNNNKNLIIVCVVLTVGVSGIYLFNAAFSGVALAMVLGVILNLVLKDNKINN